MRAGGIGVGGSACSPDNRTLRSGISAPQCGSTRSTGLILPASALRISSNRRYREATEALTSSLVELPGWPTTYRFLAASYAHLGSLGKAHEMFDRLRAITPVPVPLADCSGNSPFRDREQSALYGEGLRMAAATA
jgi:hypothetical protein